jgi:hypothetical protein
MAPWHYDRQYSYLAFLDPGTSDRVPCHVSPFLRPDFASTLQ